MIIGKIIFKYLIGMDTMTKTKVDKNNRTAMWRRMNAAAILLSAIALISSSALTNIQSISVLAAAPSNGSNSSSTSIDQTSAHILVQNLTKTNVPVTLPLTRGYVNGFEVFYISTEASDKGLADHLTNLTH